MPDLGFGGFLLTASQCGRVPLLAVGVWRGAGPSDMLSYAALTSISAGSSACSKS